MKSKARKCHICGGTGSAFHAIVYLAIAKPLPQFRPASICKSCAAGGDIGLVSVREYKGSYIARFRGRSVSSTYSAGRACEYVVLKVWGNWPFLFEATKDDRKRKVIGKSRLNKCRICGCTDDDCRQCIIKLGEPCHWVQPDLCSACAHKAEA